MSYKSPSTSSPTDPQPPGGAAPPAIHFARVKEILDGAIAGWKAKNHRDPDLKGNHDDSFGWDTREQLLNVIALGNRLIDPAKIGNGMGKDANLVIALRDPAGVQGNGRMPFGGPFLDQQQIDEIIAWIDAGTPD